MGLLGDESAFNLLTASELEMLYICRLRPVKIKSPDNPGEIVNGQDLKILNDRVTFQFQKKFVNLGVQTLFSLYDFCSYVETIYLYWRNVTTQDFINADKFKDKFPVFFENYKEARIAAFIKLEEELEFVSFMFSDISKELLWLESERKSDRTHKTDTSAFYNNYTAHFVKPESVLLDIDGKKRSVIRVGLTRLDGIKWLTTTPMELGRSGVLNQYPLAIYIQMHAIERIKERLGPFFVITQYIDILTALLEKKVCISDDGNFLIAYTLRGKKVGYLKADIIEDKLIIRTFLFITNNGTPEGKKLASLLGVQKEDKKYLGIDKISAFINSDIEQEETLKMIFCQAGCGDLFEVKKFVADGSNTLTQSAGYLLRYLCLDKQPETIDTNENG